MKKLLFFIILFTSCVNPYQKRLDEEAKMHKKYIDSLNDNYIKRTSKDSNASTVSDFTSDTIGMSVAPVRVIQSRIVKKEYSNYRDIELVYKNFSKKKVTAIRFQWFGINSFNEPADMGYSSFARGYGGGFTDDPLSPGKTDDGQWSITSRDAKKVVAAWVTEVAFADGTTWKNKAN